MLKPLITIEDWSGGASLNPSQGKKNGYFLANGADHFSRPGYVAPLPSKQNFLGPSGAGTVNDTLFCGVRTSRNLENYFGGSSGKIYRQDSSGSVALDHTSSLSNNVSNMVEYKDNLYFAQLESVGRGDLASGSNPITYTDNWQSLSFSTWKPMVVSSDNNLYIGHGYYVAQTDGSAWNAQALNLPTDYTIQDMDNFGIGYLAIAGNSSNSTKTAKVFFWDRVATTWNNETPIPEANIYSMLFVNGFLWILAGTRNVSLYVIPLGSFTPTKVFEFRDQNARTYPAVAYPNAISYRDGRLFFAISSIYTNLESFIFPTGVYSTSTTPSSLDLACHYVNIDDSPTHGHVYYFVENLGFTATQTSIYWSEQTTGTSAAKRLYRESNLPSIDLTPSDSMEIYSFWYVAPPGTYFYFDGFGFDNYPRETGDFALSYAKDFDLSTFTSIVNSYQTNNGIGSYKTKSVQCRAIMFKMSVSSGNARADLNSQNYFIKRLYATGILKADTR